MTKITEDMMEVVENMRLIKLIKNQCMLMKTDQFQIKPIKRTRYDDEWEFLEIIRYSIDLFDKLTNLMMLLQKNETNISPLNLVKKI